MVPVRVIFTYSADITGIEGALRTSYNLVSTIGHTQMKHSLMMMMQQWVEAGERCLTHSRAAHLFSWWIKVCTTFVWDSMVVPTIH